MTTRPLQLNIECDKLLEIAKMGVRRAAAFLGVGLPITENYIPETLALTQHSFLHFFPEPLPEKVERDAVREFRSWLVGNALRELDLHFSLLLDETWTVLDWAKLHRTRVSTAAEAPKPISSETNAAKKLGMVMRELGDAEPDTSMLWSMSNARNCLTHNLGVVRPRDANSNGALLIDGLPFEYRLQQGDQCVVLRAPVVDELEAPDPSQEADFVSIFVEREKRFAVAEKIELTPGDLHEICVYYSRLADQVMERVTADFLARGIGLAQPSSR